MFPGGAVVVTELPPHPAIAAPTRIITAAVPQTWSRARLCARRANPRNSRKRNATLAMSGREGALGPKKKRGIIEFVTVATVTVTLAVALEVKSMTLGLSVLPVAIVQVAFGAVVEQDRYTRPLPTPSPIMRVLPFPVVAPAFMVMGGGFPRAGVCTVER